MVADRQPKAVVGMVLVDPSIPDQEARFERVVPAQTRLAGTSEDQSFVKALRKCVAAIRTGVVRPGAPDPDQCLRPPPIPPNYPEPLRDVLAKQEATATPAMSASVMETIASYLGALDEDGRMVVSPHRNYRDMPLIVLTAGKFNVRADATQAFKDEVPARQAEWKLAHDEYAALSRQGVNRMVPGSAHIIPQEKPQAVIDAVVEVIDATSGKHNRAQ
jgi:pimeloyl-ACP methyl ester carboxylesterase